MANFLLVFVLMCCMAVKVDASQVVRLGPIDLNPSLSISEGYNDNVFFINAQKNGSWFTTINPRLQFTRKWNRLSFDMSYSLTDIRYASFSQNDTTTNLLSSSSHWIFNYRNKLDLISSLSFGQNPIGTNLTQGSVDTQNLKPVKYTRNNYQATYQFGAQGAQGNLIFRAGYSEINYDSQTSAPTPLVLTRYSYQDNYNINLGGTFLYKVMPKTQALFEINHILIKYTNKQATILNNNYYQTNYLFGATWKAAGKTTGSIKLGMFDLQYDDGRKTNLGLTGMINVTWQPWTYSGFTLTASQNNLPNIGIGTGSYINQKQFSLGWLHTWSPRLNSQLQLMAGTQNYVGTTPETSDTSMGMTVGLNYRMRPWLGFGLSYTYNRRDSNRNSYNYDQNMMVLNVNLTL